MSPRGVPDETLRGREYSKPKIMAHFSTVSDFTKWHAASIAAEGITLIF